MKDLVMERVGKIYSRHMNKQGKKPNEETIYTLNAFDTSHI